MNNPQKLRMQLDDYVWGLVADTAASEGVTRGEASRMIDRELLAMEWPAAAYEAAWL